MHIPACQTQDLEILTFQQALVPTNEDYDRTKWLYVPDYYADYRYLLGTRGENGYDSFLMFNVYAQRATRPEDMDQVCNAALHRENMAAFRYVLEQVGAGYAPAVWAAWGTIIEKRPYLRDCVRDMVAIGEAYGAQWLCAGKCSKKGHPHHPLYLRKEEKVRPFAVVPYLDSL